MNARVTKEIGLKYFENSTPGEVLSENQAPCSDSEMTLFPAKPVSSSIFCKKTWAQCGNNGDIYQTTHLIVEGVLV